MLQQIGWGYLAVVNIIAFCMFGIDKQRAIRREWRIPEAQLLLAAAAGGSLGAVLGMRFFHHKTRKWKFKAGIPAILAVQLLLYSWL